MHTVCVLRRVGGTGEDTIMAGRADEMKGGIKKGLSKLTGDDGLQAEGEAQETMGETQRKAGGALNEAKGTVKGAAGDALDSPTMEAEGMADRVRGKADQA